MTKLMEEIESKIKSNGLNYWSMDVNRAIAISLKMTQAEVRDFMAEVLIKCKLKRNNPSEVIARFLSQCTGLHSLVDADILNDFVTDLLENESCQLDTLDTISLFENLSLETIKAMVEYEKVRQHEYQSTHDEQGEWTGEGKEPIRRSSIHHSTFEKLIGHKAMTQEFMDTLASESSAGYLHAVAQSTKNPSTILRCAKLGDKNDNDYYTLRNCIENKITTPEMLAEIAELSDGAASLVLSNRRCPKSLIATIAKTAKGPAATAILQSGKTEAVILEAVIDATNDPEVLAGLAYNRSKKVTPAMLMKAYAKIPNDGWFNVKWRFLKRNDMIEVVSQMAQQVTGLKPTYIEPAFADADADDEAEALAS